MISLVSFPTEVCFALYDKVQYTKIGNTSGKQILLFLCKTDVKPMWNVEKTCIHKEIER